MASGEARIVAFEAVKTHGDGAADLRPRAALSRILEALGASLLQVLVRGPRDERDVFDVVIYDPTEEPLVSRGDLVLGVGIGDRSLLPDLLVHLGERGAAGLIVKLPLTVGPDVEDAVRRAGVPLLGLTRAASWTQVAVLVRSLLAPMGGTGAGANGAPSEDLFGLADAVSTLLDAPVTIEDRLSRVLAFSSRQDEADVGRRETILGRKVPERYRRTLEERGVFQRLSRETAPVYVEELTDGMLPRAAVALRVGEETLGSMWAAVRGPLSTERKRAFVDAARVVALHLITLRAGADVEGRLRADLLATLLEGGEGAGEAASRLGVGADRLCVAAARPLVRGEAALEAARQRLATALGVHFAAVRPRSATAVVGGTAYVVAALDEAGREDDASMLTLAEHFLERTGDRDNTVIGVGRVAHSLPELVRSRTDADRALRVLCSGRRQASAARFCDLQFDTLLLRLADLVAEDGDLLLGPVGSLIAYDRRHRGGLVETLHAYLDAFGDVAKASAVVHVHANTFRYRLRRLCEISGLDLSDPEVRLETMLMLRLDRLSGPFPGDGDGEPGAGNPPTGPIPAPG